MMPHGYHQSKWELTPVARLKLEPPCRAEKAAECIRNAGYAGYGNDYTAKFGFCLWPKPI